MNFIKTNANGVALCLIIAIPCWFLGKQFPIIGGPVFAILFGMIIALFWNGKSTLPGINFTAKKILQYAVILLGFGLNLSDIFKVGIMSLPIIISTISVALVAAFLLHKIMNVPNKISILIGVGSSICGGSAIAAAAPVIHADNEEIAQAISVIFLFNVIAAVIFPVIGTALGMGNEGFGLFAGTAINDTSSVTAAAATWDGLHQGANTLDTAAIVKLTRTLAIIPITIVLAFMYASNNKEETFKIRKAVPSFILFFILASVITTVFSAAGADVTIFSPLKELSKFFIVMAMAAIGLNTNILRLVKSGAKPIFMGLCCWVCIACVSLAMQHLMGLW